MRKLIVYAVVFVSLLTLFLPIAVQAALNRQTRAVMYTVVSGDSLWTIARGFDISVSDIVRLNNLKSDLIRPGDVLFVPRVVYLVQPGDSLWSIARQYGISISDLRISNYLTTDLIRPGQELLLPSSIRPRLISVCNEGIIRYDITPEELDLLSRLVHAEAVGEPYLGQVAVAASVLNRVESPEYPNSLVDVIHHVVGGVTYQYTPVRTGRIELPACENSRRAAEAALAGWDPTGGATGFFNPRLTNDQWVRSRRVVKIIANHVFFI